MTPAPRLLAVATAAPRFVLQQTDVMARAPHLFPLGEAERCRLGRIYANAGIESRHSCVPLSWYEEPHGWVERNRLYIENALDLLEKTARECLARANLEIADIDALVVASTTGIATPSLDALLMERMAMRRDVQRLPIFGLGCAGGVVGLARAGALARAAPGKRILFLVVELCGLTFRSNDLSKSNLVATALFGDGAAGALIGTDGDGPAILGWGEHTWPGSLDVMGWRVEEDGFGVQFSRDIPSLVRKQLRAAVDGYLAGQDLTLADIDGFVCHPGGAKVLTAIEVALGLDGGALGHARAILRSHGNMSAATAMFVLERSLAEKRRGRYLMSALGPGFTAGFLTLEVT